MYFTSLGTPKHTSRFRARETIVLARSLPDGVADEVLKAAFYELLRIDDFGLDDLEDEDLAASQAKGKGKQRDGPKLGGTINDDGEAATSRKLSPADVQRLVRTRVKLNQSWIAEALVVNSACRTVLEVPTNPSLAADPGITRIACGDYLRSRWPQLVHESGILDDNLNDPLTGLERLREASLEDWGKVCCDACADRNRKDWRNARQKIWKNLDAWLALPRSVTEL